MEVCMFSFLREGVHKVIKVWELLSQRKQVFNFYSQMESKRSNHRLGIANLYLPPL